MDLHSALDAGLERRLENWGRWGRPTGKTGTSPLYQLYREANPAEADVHPMTVDERDAMAMDAAIVRACRQYELKLLRLRYISGRSQGFICSRIGLARADYRTALDAIKRKLADFLENKQQ